MAEPLKNHYGAHVPRNIAAMIHTVFPAFASEGFIQDALDGYDKLELLPHAWQIAHTLRRHLPHSYHDNFHPEILKSIAKYGCPT